MRVFSEIGGIGAPPFFPTPVLDDRQVVAAYRALHRAFEDSADRLERDSRLLELLALLVGRWAERPPQAQRSEGAVEAVCRVRDLLLERCAENLSLDELSQAAELSPYHLNRLFRREVGMPPHAFQTQARIARAKALLREGRPIVEVAAETGFADQSHFSRCFRRLMLITPGKYVQGSKNVQDSPAKETLP
jgi:AraC-like DNA-binding protein